MRSPYPVKLNGREGILLELTFGFGVKVSRSYFRDEDFFSYHF